MFGLRLMVGTIFLALLIGCAEQPGHVPIPSGARLTHRGIFIGLAGADIQGGVSIYQSTPAVIVVLDPQFSAPVTSQTVIMLGRDGPRPASIFATLIADSGQQSFALPEHIDINAYNEIWLWRAVEGKPLGIAPLIRLNALNHLDGNS